MRRQRRTAVLPIFLLAQGVCFIVIKMGGDVRIGCAESEGIKHLAMRIKAIQEQYPAIRFHLYSGDTDDLSERLDRGLFDFAVIAETVDLSKYNYLEFPEADTWSVIMRKDSPLAQKEKICISDLLDLPLIVSRQGLEICHKCADKSFYTGPQRFPIPALLHILIICRETNAGVQTKFCLQFAD